MHTLWGSFCGSQYWVLVDSRCQHIYLEIPVGNRGFCVGIDVVGLSVGMSDNLLGLNVEGTDGVCVVAFVGAYEGAKVGFTE